MELKLADEIGAVAVAQRPATNMDTLYGWRDREKEAHRGAGGRCMWAERRRTGSRNRGATGTARVGSAGHGNPVGGVGFFIKSRRP